jgi:ABC-2 type transport system permease protein
MKIERLRVTPASRFSLMMGTVLKDVVMFIITALMVIVASSFFGFHLHWGGLVILLIMLSMITAVISAWSQRLGLIIKDIGGLAAVVTSLQLPITLLSGILLPLSLGPKWIQAIAHINLLYYAVEASRVLAGGTLYSVEALKAFLVMIPLFVIVLWWATRVYRKAVA